MKSDFASATFCPSHIILSHTLSRVVIFRTTFSKLSLCSCRHTLAHVTYTCKYPSASKSGGGSICADSTQIFASSLVMFMHNLIKCDPHQLSFIIQGLGFKDVTVRISKSNAELGTLLPPAASIIPGVWRTSSG